MPSEIEEEIKKLSGVSLTATQAICRSDRASRRRRVPTLPHFVGRGPSGLLQESKGIGSVHLELVLR